MVGISATFKDLKNTWSITNPHLIHQNSPYKNGMNHEWMIHYCKFNQAVSPVVATEPDVILLKQMNTASNAY